MSKNKPPVPIIDKLTDEISKGKLKPVYLLFGEDSYELESTAKLLEKAAMKYVESDFDRETISADKSVDAISISDLASAYPFSGGKKLLIVRHFELVSNKKNLTQICKDPPAFLILILIYSGKLGAYKSEPFQTLIASNFAYEARNPRSGEWTSWITSHAKKYGLRISEENSRSMVEFIGEDKALIDMQFQKFRDYMNEEKEVTFDLIRKISSQTKEYTVFNLTDAITANDKPAAIRIGFSLLKSGQDIIVINSMLTKYLTTIARSFEFTNKKIGDDIASKEMGISSFYYRNCKSAQRYFSDRRLIEASRAILEADLAVKTSSEDPYTILSKLISRFFV